MTKKLKGALFPGIVSRNLSRDGCKILIYQYYYSYRPDQNLP